MEQLYTINIWVKKGKRKKHFKYEHKTAEEIAEIKGFFNCWLIMTNRDAYEAKITEE